MKVLLVDDHALIRSGVAAALAQKNFEVVAKIDKKLIEKNCWQGKYYTTDIQ